jgi:hypothetical protein
MAVFFTGGQVDDVTGGEADAEEESGRDARPRGTDAEQRLRPSRTAADRRNPGTGADHQRLAGIDGQRCGRATSAPQAGLRRSSGSACR